jgi:hypothetical protein
MADPMLHISAHCESITWSWDSSWGRAQFPALQMSNLPSLRYIEPYSDLRSIPPEKPSTPVRTLSTTSQWPKTCALMPSYECPPYS